LTQTTRAIHPQTRPSEPAHGPFPGPVGGEGATSASADRGETDEGLVDRVRKGEREAFEALYQRYFKRIYGFLDRRLGNRADTEETTQEVFVNVFTSLHSYRGDAPFAAWIFGLTRRTLSARFKRKRHPTVPLFEEDDEALIPSALAGGDGMGHREQDATPYEHYERAERAAHLRQAFENQLSPEQRRVFELHHLESLPIAEIARTLSKSEDSVKSNLYRTRKILLAR